MSSLLVAAHHCLFPRANHFCASRLSDAFSQCSRLHNHDIKRFEPSVDRLLCRCGSFWASKAVGSNLYDTYVNWRYELPIPQGAASIQPLVRIEGGTWATVATLKAVIFSDGSTQGAQEDVNEILERRQIIFDRLGEMTDLLSDMRHRNLGKAEALGELARVRWSRDRSVSSLPIEVRRTHDFVFSATLRRLDGGLLVNGRAPGFPDALELTRGILGRWRNHLKTSRPLLVESGELSNRMPTEPGRLRLVSAITSEGTNLTASGKKEKYSVGRSKPPDPVPGCTLANAAQVVTPPDTCGNTQWNLIANVGGMTVSHGNAWSFGACVGGYWDCYVYNSQWVVNGGQAIFQVQAPQNQLGYFWRLDRWTASYIDAGCECTDPNPQGIIEIRDRGEFFTPAYYSICP